MQTFLKQVLGVAILGLAALALLVAPVHAGAATLATGENEIPAFVLDHVELTPGARVRAG
jgi:hypothetical protein